MKVTRKHYHGIKVWWHCLWRMFKEGHIQCNIQTITKVRHFCKCGYMVGEPDVQVRNFIAELKKSK